MTLQENLQRYPSYDVEQKHYDLHTIDGIFKGKTVPEVVLIAKMQTESVYNLIENMHAIISSLRSGDGSPEAEALWVYRNLTAKIISEFLNDHVITMTGDIRIPLLVFSKQLEFVVVGILNVISSLTQIEARRVKNNFDRLIKASEYFEALSNYLM